MFSYIKLAAAIITANIHYNLNTSIEITRSYLNVIPLKMQHHKHHITVVSNYLNEVYPYFYIYFK